MILRCPPSQSPPLRCFCFALASPLPLIPRVAFEMTIALLTHSAAFNSFHFFVRFFCNGISVVAFSPSPFRFRRFASTFRDARIFIFS
jgi:hypothetical protein